MLLQVCSSHAFESKPALRLQCVSVCLVSMEILERGWLPTLRQIRPASREIPPCSRALQTRSASRWTGTGISSARDFQRRSYPLARWIRLMWIDSTWCPILRCRVTWSCGRRTDRSLEGSSARNRLDSIHPHRRHSLFSVCGLCFQLTAY